MGIVPYLGSTARPEMMMYIVPSAVPFLTSSSPSSYLLSSLAAIGGRVAMYYLLGGGVWQCITCWVLLQTACRKRGGGGGMSGKGRKGEVVWEAERECASHVCFVNPGKRMSRGKNEEVSRERERERERERAR